MAAACPLEAQTRPHACYRAHSGLPSRCISAYIQRSSHARTMSDRWQVLHVRNGCSKKPSKMCGSCSSGGGVQQTERWLDREAGEVRGGWRLRSDQ